jgi:hypothetical protein
MSQQTINGYVVKHLRGVITITKGSSVLKFTPAEADQVRHLINIALGMESLPALPPKISDGRFTVTFNENDTLSVSAMDGREGALTFQWNEGDEFIGLVDNAQAIALNDLKMGVVL